jgi:Xaa-Pro aminopeptidase
VKDPYDGGGSGGGVKDPYGGGAPAGGGGGVSDPYGVGAPADPYGDPAADDPFATLLPVAVPRRALDLAAVQGLLAVQALDGWLLYDRDGQNPIAASVVAPAGTPTRGWFYFIPEEGEPRLLCHASELQRFDGVPGRRTTYATNKELGKALKALLAGVKTVAMEYAPKAQLPSISRVDAGTVERLAALGVTVKSSAGLVQFTKAQWGSAGRAQHEVAAHHLAELRRDALAWLAARLARGAAVTELALQRRLARGMAVRGLVGPAPAVAAGVHTADPTYTPTAQTDAPIRAGDLVQLSLAGRTADAHGIYAALTWVAFVGDEVPEEAANAFGAAALARDEAIATITDRVTRRRPIKGADVDRVARAFLASVGLAEQFPHRTGHSLDGDLHGGGANLDDLEVTDERLLVVGTGFTIGPGVYVPGRLGARVEVSAFLGGKGLEITTPRQDAIELVRVSPAPAR